MLVTQTLLTIVTLGFSAGPAFADINRTHATNPFWTPHARFHVEWQVASYLGIGVICLVLIWWPGPRAAERLWLAAAIAATIYAGFFAALFAMKFYGGRTHDANGYVPAYVSLLGKRIGFDANITAFSLMTALMLGAVAMIPAY